MIAVGGIGARAAGDLTDARRTAEFAHRDHKGLVQQPPVGQVLQERGKGAIGHRQDRLPEQVELLPVCIPGLIVPPAGADRHQPHPRFDQPAGQKQALPEVR